MRLTILSVVLVGLAMVPPRATATEDTVTIPLLIHVGPRLGTGEPSIAPAFMQQQVERANDIFRPARVAFEIVGYEPLNAELTHLEDRRARHELAGYLRHKVVNVFAVQSMRDVDDPTQWRRGVHWRHPNDPNRHYVVVTSIGPDTTLAHELGHFFGNRNHSVVPGNIMSYNHGPRPRFTTRQVERVHYTSRRMLRTRRLRPVEAVHRLFAEGGILPMWPRTRHARVDPGLL